MFFLKFEHRERLTLCRFKRNINPRRIRKFGKLPLDDCYIASTLLYFQWKYSSIFGLHDRNSIKNDLKKYSPIFVKRPSLRKKKCPPRGDGDEDFYNQLTNIVDNTYIYKSKTPLRYEVDPSERLLEMKKKKTRKYHRSRLTHCLE